MTDKAPTIFEDDINTGNSPVTITLADTQGHPIGGFIVVNTGPARFTVQESITGDAFGDFITIESGDVYKINSRTEQVDSSFLDRIKITRGTTDSSFKVIGSAGEVDFKPNPMRKSGIATLPEGIALNAVTTVTISAVNLDRTGFYVSNDNPLDCWIKFQAASVDNLKKGILLPAGSIYEMPPEKYTGEISAIADVAPLTVFITEY